jgi:hypothetical protein
MPDAGPGTGASAARSAVTDAPPAHRWSGVAAALCVLAAFVLISASHFTIGELKLDDASTFLVASRPLAQIAPTAMAFHAQPPLFYLALHEWLRVGDTEAVLRLLPFLFMLGAAITLLCTSWLPPIARVIATALLLLTSFSDYLTTALRPYALSTWLSLASCLVFVRLLQAPRRAKMYVFYTVLTVLMVYSVAMGTWTLVGQGVCAATVIAVAWWRDGFAAARRRYLPLLVSLSVVGALLLPYVVSVWRLQGAMGHPTLAASLTAALNPRYYISGPIYLLGLPLGLGYLALATALYEVWRGVTRRDPVPAALFAIVLIQIALTHGFLEGRTDFGFRYLAPAFPALVVLSGLGAARLLARLPAADLIPVLGAVVVLGVAIAVFVRSPRTAPVGVWRQMRADLQRMPGHKFVYFDIGWDAQRLQYEVRHDPDVRIMSDADTGWATGGRLMTREYVSRTIDQQFDPTARYFYQFDPVTNGEVFAAAFAPAMARHHCRRVYERAVPSYTRDVPDGGGALVYGYACDGA